MIYLGHEAGVFQNLLEITFPDQSQPVVDREAGVIRGVKVIGRKSRNNREYSPRAISQLAPMYEGIGVNLNHPPPAETGRDRAFHDGIGWLEKPHEKDDGVYADLHLLKSHPWFGTVMEAAERNPKRFGLSHNADGKVSSQNGKNVVDEIEKVRSVDIVQNPATNVGLFESENTMKITVRKLLESKIWSSAVMRRSSLFPKPTVGQVARNLLEDSATMPYAEDEMDGDGGAADGDDSAVEAALLRVIKGVLGGEGSLQDKMAKVSALCAKYGMGGSAATPEGIGGPDRVPGDLKNQPYSDGDGAPGPGGAKGPANPNGIRGARESVEEIINTHPLVKELRESLAEEKRLRLRDRCRILLESSNRAVDDFRINALIKLGDDDERQQLVESWPEKEVRYAPRPATSFPLTESTTIPKDAATLARAIR